MRFNSLENDVARELFLFWRFGLLFFCAPLSRLQAMNRTGLWDSSANVGAPGVRGGTSRGGGAVGVAIRWISLAAVGRRT